MRRVVITGIGPVTSIGTGKENFFQALIDHQMAIKKIPAAFERGYTFKSRHYSPHPDINLNEYGFPQYYEKVTQGEDKLALIASNIALTDAGFTLTRGDKNFRVSNLESCGVILGIGTSGLESGFQSYLAHVCPDQTKIAEMMGDTKIRYNRMIVPMIMPNSVASWVSISYGLTGTSYTVNSACASGTSAIGNAYEKILTGAEDVILTGGVECLSDTFGGFMRGFDMLNVLTQSPDGVPNPFSKTSTGFLFSQGAACILILEEFEHALKRSAHMYAEILDFQSNSDAYNIVQIDPEGKQIQQLLKKLSRGRTIDYINAHGSGTPVNDAIESHAIAEIFGPKKNQPYINSTKGILGHTIGASGALEAAVTALSIDQSQIHGNQIPEPRENLNLVTQSINTEVNTAISTSYGFGGHNAGLLFKKL